MANVLTELAPTLFSAARVVPRELTGLLAAVTRDFNDQGAAVGDTVKVPIVPAMSTSAVTPAQVFTAGADRTAGSSSLTLSQFKEASWNLTAEQERSLMNPSSNGNARELLRQTIEQAFRTLINEIEAYTWAVARKNASRAVGTAGTTPFASDITAAPIVRQILQDNGAPDGDRSLVIDSNAGVKLRSLGNMIQYYQAGTDEVLKEGILSKVSGLLIRESAAIAAVTKGTGTLYTSTTAGFAIGTTSIPLITGSGTVLAGDCVTFAGDANIYIVKTGVAAPGTIVLHEPGLKKALAASAVAMTIGGDFTPNLALHRSAVCAVVRPGLQPVGAVADQMTISDPVTGLSGLLLRVPGSAMSSWYLRMVYDAFAPNPFANAILLG